MSSYKSLGEIRELLDGFVEPDLMNYPPNHEWIINQYDSEWQLTSSSNRMTLYHVLIIVADFDYLIPYELYEYCVSEGHAWADYQHIVYDSPLGPGTDMKSLQNDILTPNYLELECISLIKQLAGLGAGLGDFDDLRDIRYHLLENLNRQENQQEKRYKLILEKTKSHNRIS
jgi:hypothetical protein